MKKFPKFELKAIKYLTIGGGIPLGSSLTSFELIFNEMIRILWIAFTLTICILFILKGCWLYYCGWKEEKKSDFKSLNN